MSLLTIAQVLSGEARVSPGGVVDAETAAGSDAEIWPPIELASEPAVVSVTAARRDRTGVQLEVPVLV